MFRALSYAAMLSFALAGCDCGEDIPPADPDAGSIAGADGGVVGPGDRTVLTTVAQTGGGGTMTSDNFKVRLVIGAPAPVGQGSTTDTTVKLGTGSDQHGQ